MSTEGDEPLDDTTDGPAEPAAERVTVAVCEAVRGIARITGYWDDVRVTRPNPGDPEPLRHAAVEVLLDAETKETAMVSFGVEQIRATYALVCEVISPESKRALPDTLINRIKADVKRAVLLDFAEGGLGRIAMEVTFGDAELQATDAESRTGRVVLLLDVVYRTREDDPYAFLEEPQ